MKHLLLIAITLLTACGGSLTDEQRKKIKQDMAQHKIVRVTEAEITTAAFEHGRSVFNALTGAKKDALKWDSIGNVYHVKIRWIEPNAKSALDIEQQLIEAYLASSTNGGLQDNVQKLDADSLLYTLPVSEKLPDGSENIKGMWSVKISKKELILSLGK